MQHQGIPQYRQDPRPLGRVQVGNRVDRATRKSVPFSLQLVKGSGDYTSVRSTVQPYIDCYRALMDLTILNNFITINLNNYNNKHNNNNYSYNHIINNNNNLTNNYYFFVYNINHLSSNHHTRL